MKNGQKKGQNGLQPILSVFQPITIDTMLTHYLTHTLLTLHFCKFIIFTTVLHIFGDKLHFLISHNIFKNWRELPKRDFIDVFIV